MSISVLVGRVIARHPPPMPSPLPIATAPRDSTLVLVPLGGRADRRYWSKTFIGWVAYHEDIPLIRHDVTDWEPIADQAAARAVPLVKIRRSGVTTVVLGTVKAARRPAAPIGRRPRKLVVVLGR